MQISFNPGQIITVRDAKTYIVSEIVSESDRTLVLVLVSTIKSITTGYEIIPCSDYTPTFKHKTNFQKDINSINDAYGCLLFKCELSIEISHRQAYCLIEKFKAPFMCEVKDDEFGTWRPTQCHGVRVDNGESGPCMKFIVAPHDNAVDYCRVLESLLKSDANET